MVGFANVSVAESERYVKSRPDIWEADIKPPRHAGSISVSKEKKLPWKHTGEELKWQPFDVPSTTVSVAATGAQIPSLSQDIIATESTVAGRVPTIARMPDIFRQT